MPAVRAEANPLDAIASFFGIGEGAPTAESNAPVSGSRVVDSPSHADWSDVVDSTTENIGRIWTDKSVYDEDVKLPGVDGQPDAGPTIKLDGSKYLVGLSALSSMSNTTTTTSTPLDIVLVLDTSGSMGDPGRAVYADSLDKSKTYYMSTGGIFGASYREITWNDSQQSWGYQRFLRWNSVTPKASESDSGTQLYLHGSKMGDLKAAAKDFVEKTREANASIEGQGDKHRIALVTFSSGSVLRSGLGIVDDTHASELNSLLDGLSANGATEADNGFSTAKDELKNARADAQKAVIFFTDGDPGQSGFDEDTANRAVDTALAMKNDDTLVFSVGTFNGANPDSQTNSNQFMNAVSSNYPKATKYDDRGERVEGKDYYFAESEGQSLGEIFNTIFDEVTSGTGSPTEVETGHPSDESGYITFTDKLGSYMQVDDFKSILFADQLFENPTKTTEGNTTKYTFSGTVADSDLYPNAEMSDLLISVQHSDTAAEGDTVTVKIPASLIPLRKFQVYPEGNPDGKTSTVTNTWPMRIYFGVSPKPEVAGLLANPDEAMLDYIAANRNADTGTVSFYTNDYAASDPGKTIANFTPAENNSYYFFTEDTPIYTSEACDARVTGPLNASDTYWYQREYYSIEGGKSVVKTAKYSFRGDSAIALSGAVAYDASGAYLKKGSPRVTHIDELHKEKVNNATGTGTDVINPTWNHEDSVDAATQINVRLGNNGRFDVELPGALAVSKTVVLPAGYADDAFDNTDFTFDITLTDAQGAAVVGTYAAAVEDAKGALTQIKDGITFDDRGKASHAIKPGETLYVYGLADGVKYAVVERAVTGFTTISDKDKGSIVAGQVVMASFENTYAPAPVELAESAIRAQKNLEGRTWQEGDSFEIRLRAEGDAPMPDGSATEDNIRYKSVTVTNDSAGSDSEKDSVTFGKIAYTAPGEYQYTIHEEAPANRIPGVTYTDAIYRVWVSVADANLDGKLDTPKVVMKQTYDDNGDAIDNPSETTDGIAVFTNRYSVQEVNAAPQGVKTLVGANQQLGEDPFTFKFKVTAMQDGTPVPTTANPSGRADNGESFTVGHARNGNITFGLAKFGSTDLNRTYVYRVEEVIPDDARDSQLNKAYKDATEDERKTGTWKLNGVTYDNTIWLASVKLNAKTVGSDQILDPIWTYEASGSTGASTASQIVFSNSYAADPVMLADDNLIKGSKTLKGRDFKESESFGFTIQAHDPSTEAAINDGSIADLKGLATPVKVDRNASGGAFDFGNAIFSKVGTYRFDVYESHWNDAPIQGDMQDKKGMTFDSSMYVVTVAVTDNAATGKLEAKTTYVKGGSAVDKADFINTYSTSGSFGDIAGSGITVGKTLSGRAMAAGEFDFTIKAMDGVDNAAEAKKKLDALSEANRSFSNRAYAEGQKWTTEKLNGLSFTNEDAGKTFSYIVDEVEPAAGKAKPGVTYDKSEFRVDLTVSDDGDGKLSVATDIKRVKDKSGSGVDESVAEIAFANTYKPDSITVDFGADAYPQLYKILNGRDWKNGDAADEFTFEVTAQNGAPTPANATSPYKLTLSGKGQSYKSGEKVPFDIGTIEFSQAGTYTYEVKELEGAIPGITYDSATTAVVTVRVVDNTATGKLEVAEVRVSPDTFTNVYSVQVDYADMVNFKLTKQLTGGKMTANQFTFTITAKDGQSADKFAGALEAGVPEEFTGPSQAAIDAAGGGDTVDMPPAVHAPLTFTTADSRKTFTYTFAEVDKAEQGYTYDKTSYELAITPRDMGDGTMDITTVVTTFVDGKQHGEPQTYEAKADQSDQQKPNVTLPFVNSYKAVAFEGVPVDLEFSKVLKGKSWKGDTFEFVMKGIEGTNTAGFSAGAMVDRSNGTASDADGTHEMAPFGFGKLAYTEPGVYAYEVTEVIPDDAVNEQGIRYGDATSDQKKQGVWTLHGVQYDTHTAAVTVNVTDERGALAATAQVKDGRFTNEYKAQINYGQAGGLAITKTLNGRNMLADQFSFTVDPGDDASAKLIGLDADGTTLQLRSPEAQVGNKALVGNVFNGVTFTQDNVGETYTYVISEDNADSLGEGYTCTGSKSFEVSIAVEDAGEGKLRVKTTVKGDKNTAADYVYETGVTPGQKASADFVNEYTAAPVVLGGDGQVKINAIKTLAGRDMIEGEFAFTVYNVTNGKNIELVAGKNAAAGDGVAGDIAFEPIRFTSDKLARDLSEGKVNAVVDYQTGATTYTYDYRIDETSGFDGDTGVSQGAKSFDVQVTVIDDNKGNLAVSVGYPAGSNDTLGFTNFYGKDAEANVQVNGIKRYNVPQGGDYKVPDIEGKFSFTLEGKDGAPMPAGSADGKLTVKNAAGNVDFGVISYTMENVWGASAVTTGSNAEESVETIASNPREKTFTYTVTESGSVNGVANDPSSVREFTVTVADDGKGNITAKPSFGSDRAFTFTNSYTVDPGVGSLTGNGGFKITKQLKGRNLVEGEFEFTLIDATGAVVASAKNAADGTVIMPDMTFDKPGVYRYTLAEAKGAAGGVTYDETVYDVVATVTHDSEAATALSVQWTVDGHNAGDELMFANTYEAVPTSVMIRAAKVLKGRDLKAGEFEFVLSENGKKLRTAKNNADGGVTFDVIEYAEAGTHVYEITEVNGGLDGVTYDETVHTVTINVFDDGNGKLSFAYEFGENGEPVFVNTYEKADDAMPADPKPGDKHDDLPRTGDMSSLLVIPLVAGVGMLLAGERSRRYRNSR